MPLQINDLEQRIKRTFINNLIKKSKLRLTNTDNLDGAIMDINNTLLNEEQFEEAMQLVKDNIVVEASTYRTLIFLVIKDLQDKNKPLSISCSNGLGISGYAKVRDVNEDCYLLDGVECYSLGSIPFAIKMTVPNSGGWSIDVPMPDKMVERYLAPFFKRQLKEVKQKYPKPKFEWNYFQILSCN